MGQDPSTIRQDIEQTRERMGDTVDALAYKSDVKARAKASVSDRVDSIRGRVTGAAHSVGESAPSSDDLQHDAHRAVGIAQENPLGLAIGATALGFLAGLLIPSTSLEDRRIGPIADQVKDHARDAAQTAVGEGGEAAREAAHAALEAARDTGAQRAAGVKDEVQREVRDPAGHPRDDRDPADAVTPGDEDAGSPSLRARRTGSSSGDGGNRTRQAPVVFRRRAPAAPVRRSSCSRVSAMDEVSVVGCMPAGFAGSHAGQRFDPDRLDVAGQAARGRRRAACARRARRGRRACPWRGRRRAARSGGGTRWRGSSPGAGRPRSSSAVRRGRRGRSRASRRAGGPGRRRRRRLLPQRRDAARGVEQRRLPRRAVDHEGRTAENAVGISSSPRPPSSIVASWRGTATSTWRVAPGHAVGEIGEQRCRPGVGQAGAGGMRCLRRGTRAHAARPAATARSQ